MTLLLLTALLTPAADADPVKEEMAKLEGTWQLV